MRFQPGVQEANMADWIKVTYPDGVVDYVNLDAVARVYYQGQSPRAVLCLLSTYDGAGTAGTDRRIVVATGDEAEKVRDAIERRLSAASASTDSPPTPPNPGLAL